MTRACPLRRAWIVSVLLCTTAMPGCRVEFEEVSVVRPAQVTVFLAYTDSLGVPASELVGFVRAPIDADGTVAQIEDPVLTVGSHRIPLRPRADATVGVYEGTLATGPGPLDAAGGLWVRAPRIDGTVPARDQQLPPLRWRGTEELKQDPSGDLPVTWESSGSPSSDSTRDGNWRLVVEANQPSLPGAPRRRLVMQAQGLPPRPLVVDAALLPGPGPWQVALEVSEDRVDVQEAWEFRGNTRSRLLWIARPADPGS